MRTGITELAQLRAHPQHQENFSWRTTPAIVKTKIKAAKINNAKISLANKTSKANRAAARIKSRKTISNAKASAIGATSKTNGRIGMTEKRRRHPASSFSMPLAFYADCWAAFAAAFFAARRRLHPRSSHTTSHSASAHGRNNATIRIIAPTPSAIMPKNATSASLIGSRVLSVTGAPADV